MKIERYGVHKISGETCFLLEFWGDPGIGKKILEAFDRIIAESIVPKPEKPTPKSNRRIPIEELWESLMRNDWTVSRVAAEYDLSRGTIYNRMSVQGISRNKEKAIARWGHAGPSSKRDRTGETNR